MKPIKFATPDLTKTEISKVKKVILSRWITNGPTVREFEKKIAECSGCEKAVAFDSCTAAMELTLRLLGIGPGDEVITTPYTYTATADVIEHTGAKIVFVDLDSSSFEMDYERVAAAITERTKAVMPVDIGGKLCNYESLTAAVCSHKELFHPNNELQEAIGRVAIVADAAHSLLAESKGLVSGQHADFTCFSFHVLKNITTGGEGGAVVWKNIKGISNDDIEQKFRLLADHGQTSRDKSKGWEYDIRLLGYNHIMTDMDAAMGLAQLERFDELLRKRKHVTSVYDILFDGSAAEPMIRHFGVGYMSAMHLYPIHIPGDEDRRNEVFLKLRDRKVPCNVHYKPLPMFTGYKELGYDIKDYPNAYKMFSNLLTIPYHTELTEKQQEYIAETIKRTVRE